MGGKMVSWLIECLTAYKSQMEYRNKDFNAERPAKYKEMKSEIAELYGNVFVSVCRRKR